VSSSIIPYFKVAIFCNSKSSSGTVNYWAVSVGNPYNCLLILFVPYPNDPFVARGKESQFKNSSTGDEGCFSIVNNPVALLQSISSMAIHTTGTQQEYVQGKDGRQQAT
jgi:hypothetical protein